MSNDARTLSTRWADTMSAATRNLVDFSSSEICQLVKARLRLDHPQTYKGLTAMRGAAARSELNALLQDYLPLARIVDQAQSLAAKTNILFNHDKEIIELLTGPSVKVNSQPPAPSGSRDLLSGARTDDYCTPAQALESMQNRFAAAHDSFMAIHEAQIRFQASLDSLEAQKTALAAQALSLGLPITDSRDIQDTDFEVDPSDPLSSQDAIEIAQSKLKNLADELQTKAEQAQKATTALMQASHDLIALRSACARNAMSISQSLEVFCTPLKNQAPAASQDAVAFLDQWKSKLDATLAAGKFSACLVGAAKLKTAISDQAELTARALSTNRQLLDNLADLRGRFEAFSAKAKALRAQGAVLSPAVFQLQNSCAISLSAHPPELASITRLVSSFEASIAALGS